MTNAVQNRLPQVSGYLLLHINMIKHTILAKISINFELNFGLLAHLRNTFCHAPAEHILQLIYLSL